MEANRLENLERRIDTIGDLCRATFDALNSLAERITGDQFTVVISNPGGREIILRPRLDNVVWHPLEALGGGVTPFVDPQHPEKNRNPVPAVVRRAIVEMPSILGWRDVGLGPCPPAPTPGATDGSAEGEQSSQPRRHGAGA